MQEQITSLLDKGKLLSKNGTILLINKIPSKGQRIAALLTRHFASETELCIKLQQAEELFFNGKDGNDETKDLFSWDENTVTEFIKKEGANVTCTIEEFTEERYITMNEIEIWFDPERSKYGSFIAQKLNEDELLKLKKLLLSLTQHIVQWSSRTAFFVVRELAQQ